MISDTIQHSQVLAAKKLINQSQSVAIVTHMSPDGDAMGSSLAMRHYLHQLGKELVAVIVPNRFPDFLAWLPTADEVINYDGSQAEADTILKSADLIICLDFNEPKRIGSMAETVMQSKAKKIMIDHHINPSDFPDVVMSYPDSPSTCELVFRFICSCGNFSLINRTIADCIYTGMMTDTMNFSVNSNHIDTYSIIAELVRIGVDKDDIYSRVNNTYSVDRMRLMGFCLYKKMKIYSDVHTAIIALTRKEQYMFNFTVGDAEGLVNLPLQIKDIYYSVFIREDKDKIKISFRSKGNRPVNEFAARYFNGGGHFNAAGGESYDTVDKTVARLEEHLSDFSVD